MNKVFQYETSHDCTSMCTFFFFLGFCQKVSVLYKIAMIRSNYIEYKKQKINAQNNLFNTLKEHVALDRSSWSLKSVWNRLQCLVFLLCREETRSPILWSQNVDSIIWPVVLVGKVKGKPCNFEWYLCGSLYSTFNN